MMKLKIQLFFVFSLLVGNISFSQESVYVDSLLQVIQSDAEDTTKVNSYILLANEYYSYDTDTTLYYSSQALSLAKKIGFKEGAAAAYNWSGYILELQGNLDSAVYNYNVALNIFLEVDDKMGVGESYINLGLAAYNLRHVEEALDYNFKCLKLREDIGDQRGVAEVLNNLAIIYYDNGDIEEAIERFEECLIIQREIGDDFGMAYTLNNLGAIYFDQGEPQRGLDSCLISAELRKQVGDLWGLSYSYNNLGMMYEEGGDIEKGLEFYQKSYEINKELGDIAGACMMSFQIGDTYYNIGNINKSKEYADKSMDNAMSIGYPAHIKDAALLKKKVAIKMGDFKEAYYMLELFSEMKDSLINEANQKSIIEQKEKYKYEKLAAADSIKVAEAKKVTDAQILAQDTQISKDKLRSKFLFGGLALLILFGGFMYNRFKKTQKQKKIIESQKDEVEIQKLEAESQRELVEEKNKEIMDSINYAKRIQSAILPPAKIVKEYLQQSFILYKPKDVVAGDFYWMEASLNSVTKQKIVLFAAADCTGHGVPGAMVSVVCNNGLNRSVREHGLTEPGEILDKTREIIIQEFEKSEEDVKDGMDIALCSLETKNSESKTTAVLKYAGAHNPLWIIRDGSEIVEEIKANKQPIGKFDKLTPYTTHTIDLFQGDSIYIFSDGYVDQFGGERGKKFKARAFRELLLSIQNKQMEEQRLIIDAAFEDWRGDLEQIDDVCVIGVKV